MIRLVWLCVFLLFPSSLDAADVVKRVPGTSNNGWEIWFALNDPDNALGFGIDFLNLCRHDKATAEADPPCYTPYPITIEEFAITLNEALATTEDGHITIQIDGIDIDEFDIIAGPDNTPTCSESSHDGDLDTVGESCLRKGSGFVPAGGTWRVHYYADGADKFETVISITIFVRGRIGS